MTALAWTESLRLHQPQMDATHEEFVDLLAQVRTALVDGEQARALAAYERLVEHTAEHFAQEDRWMLATGFAPGNCHTRQHESVLRVMREGVRVLREHGDWSALGEIVRELGQWFPQHARMMDAGLAVHMAEVGFDPATGHVAGTLPEAALTHCGSAGCR
ncbi:hemerythrin domain-containing protein [Aquincola sp. MAHUQ-54]|uniref:Hemerythrin domain-containing protein n=1 Tax=Aquincola agrisoli TaxID=3119538 RepID=A0AAW9Q7Z1_9BURK